MLNDPSTKRRILFVDDDPGFLQMVDRLVRLRSRNALEIVTAQSAGAALALIQDQPLDLVVLDVCMPVVDGLQFLSILNRRYPGLQKVVLTGFATDAYRNACLSSGAELFLEKPRTSDGMESVFATLVELARWRPEPGFRGVLRRVGLIDVIQMECLGRSSSLLSVTSPKQSGSIYIHEGSIVHAECGDISGEDAFKILLGLASGDFRLNPFHEPPARTISGSWEGLLMDAAQSRDEFVEPEPAPALSLPEAPEADLPEGESEAPAIRVDELMICSDAGDVYHAWQCPNTDLRVSFLEFLSQKTRLLINVLPLGTFDRAEFRAESSRLVAQVQAGRGVVLRTSLEGSPELPNARVNSNKTPTPEIKEKAQKWFQDHLDAPGLLAATLHFSDRSGAAHTVSNKFAPDSLDTLKRSVSDGFQVLRLQRFPANRARWVYDQTAIESAQWQDGTTLALVFSRQSVDLNTRLVDTMIEKYLAAEKQ